MASSDLDMLVDMGFEKEKATLAVKKTGNLQGAIDWLEKNQDKSTEEIKAEEAEETPESKANVEAIEGGEAKSLICNECGKKFRNTAQAEFHASKTEHTDFSESTDEIAPLTEEEKKQRLEDLKAKLAAKRANQAEQDREERKQNEAIRRKATAESQDIKEDLQRREQIKEAAKKRAEKKADIDHKNDVLAKIAADKAERKRKAELEKAQRAGQAPPPEPVAAAAPPQAPKSSATYTEARLRLQVEGSKPIMKTYPAETTLFEIAADVEKEVLGGVEGAVNAFQINFPKKTFDKADFGMTVKEAGWVPSAALIVR